ncbi:peroxide stress protein YaaA [Moraxella boevrei]|uniref:peroxide stress protein YaaA n=1 Tax=Faucicola boevrei TaxID=346665 RepID=UPI0037360CFE
MYFLLSPAKNLNETDTPPLEFSDYSQPALMPLACELMSVLKPLEPTDLMQLMGISHHLAELNKQRNDNWQWDETRPFQQSQGAKPAIYLFDGDVYTSLNAYQLNQAQILYLNQQLGILSGLYGLLKPLDLMLPYRLEMGTKLTNPHGKDLYQFWGDTISELINQRMAENGDKVLVNLASNEYFKAVNNTAIHADIVTPRFEDGKNGAYKVVSFYAKKARGLMVRYACENQLTTVDELKNFDSDGYYFVENLSDDKQLLFRRDND